MKQQATSFNNLSHLLYIIDKNATDDKIMKIVKELHLDIGKEVPQFSTLALVEIDNIKSYDIFFNILIDSPYHIASLFQDAINSINILSSFVNDIPKYAYSDPLARYLNDTETTLAVNPLISQICMSETDLTLLTRKTIMLINYICKFINACINRYPNVLYTKITNTAMDDSNFTSYSDKAMSTATYPGHHRNNAIYPILALFEEVGEMAGKLAKGIRDREYGFTLDTTSIPIEDKNEIAKELGDILWQLNATCNEMGFPLQEIADKNIKKLEDRQKRNVIKGDGDNR